jgi:tetratricopeptide (TPR) repeat protein
MARSRQENENAAEKLLATLKKQRSQSSDTAAGQAEADRILREIRTLETARVFYESRTDPSQLGSAIEECNQRIATLQAALANHLSRPEVQVEDDSKVFDEAIAQDRKNPVLYDRRALHHLLRKNFNAAIADCKRALELDPDATVTMIHCGEAYEGVKDYNSAFSFYRKAHKSLPKFYGPHHRLASLHNKLGNPFQAAHHARQALRNYPDHLDSIHELAAAYLSLGRPRTALRYYRNLFDRDPTELESSDHADLKVMLYRQLRDDRQLSQPLVADFAKQASRIGYRRDCPQRPIATAQPTFSDYATLILAALAIPLTLFAGYRVFFARQLWSIWGIWTVTFVGLIWLDLRLWRSRHAIADLLVRLRGLTRQSLRVPSIDESLELHREAIALTKESSDTLTYAEALYSAYHHADRNNRPETAAEFLVELIKILPMLHAEGHSLGLMTIPHAHTQVMRCLQQAGHTHRAVEHGSTAIRVDDDNGTVFLTYLNCIRELYLLGHSDQAVTHAQNIARNLPVDPSAGDPGVRGRILDSHGFLAEVKATWRKTSYFDLSEAFIHARKACDLEETPNSRTLGVLWAIAEAIKPGSGDDAIASSTSDQNVRLRTVECGRRWMEQKGLREKVAS